VEKCKYESIEEGIALCITTYLKALQHLVTAKNLRAYIHPVAPVLDVTRKIVLTFNKMLEPAVRQAKVTPP
jgi:hypothetical protein